MVALVPVTFALGFYDRFFGPGVGSMLIELVRVVVLLVVAALVAKITLDLLRG
jgi:hypothetical protein